MGNSTCLFEFGKPSSVEDPKEVSQDANVGPDDGKCESIDHSASQGFLSLY